MKPQHKLYPIIQITTPIKLQLQEYDIDHPSPNPSTTQKKKLEIGIIIFNKNNTRGLPVDGFVHGGAEIEEARS